MADWANQANEMDVGIDFDPDCNGGRFTDDASQGSI